MKFHASEYKMCEWEFSSLKKTLKLSILHKMETSYTCTHSGIVHCFTHASTISNILFQQFNSLFSKASSSSSSYSNLEVQLFILFLSLVIISVPVVMILESILLPKLAKDLMIRSTQNSLFETIFRVYSVS